MNTLPKSKFDGKSLEWLIEVEREKAHEDETTGCEVVHPLVIDALTDWNEEKLDNQTPVISQAVNCISTEVIQTFAQFFTVGMSGEGAIILITPENLQALAIFAIQAGFEVLPQIEERWTNRGK